MQSPPLSGHPYRLAFGRAPSTQFTLHGGLLARGREQLAERFRLRFQEPDLHARLLSRTVLGNYVVDAEVITRNFVEGPGTVEMLCIYEVIDGKIRRASFGTGEQKLAQVRQGRG